MKIYCVIMMDGIGLVERHGFAKASEAVTKFQALEEQQHIGGGFSLVDEAGFERTALQQMSSSGSISIYGFSLEVERS